HAGADGVVEVVQVRQLGAGDVARVDEGGHGDPAAEQLSDANASLDGAEQRRFPADRDGVAAVVADLRRKALEAEPAMVERTPTVVALREGVVLTEDVAEAGARGEHDA